MPLLPFGEYRPDVADYEGSTTRNIQNVVPRGDGYGPFPSFTSLTQALPATCRGAFYALKSDGSVAIFAGTADRLYLLNNTDYSWTPVSKEETVTISNASPAVVTFTSHPFQDNDPVKFSTTGSLPTGLTAGTVYFVNVVDADSFTVSATAGGTPIDTSSAGSGTHSATSAYLDLSSTAQWRFAQFNDLVIAAQANAVPQVYDLSSSNAFDDLAGSPPQSAYVDVVGRFVVLSGLLSQPYRIQWSGLNDVNSADAWTPGINSSDYQDLPDGGIVCGVAGGEFGTIFQDQAIRRMSYVPGSPIVFQIERISQDKGLYAPYSVVRAGETVLFYAGQGFHKIEPGGLPQQIGRERIDRTFLTDLDSANLQLFMGAADPRSSRVYWAYKSTAGQDNLFDKILGYDKVLDRWFPVSMTGEFLVGLSQAGLTLENLDAISSSLDALAVTLDAYPSAVQPEISQFSSEHKMGFFRGVNLEATIETSEQGTDGRRLFVKGFRPITDSSTVSGSLSFRETQSAAVNATGETSLNARTGRIDLRKSTRYGRFKVRIPSGTEWTYIAGVEPDVALDGMQ